MEESELSDLLQELLDLSSSSNWADRHGAVLTLSSLLRHNPSTVFMSLECPSILLRLKSSLKDEKVLQF